MPDHLALDHLALDDLADLAVGELPVDARSPAEDHLAGCASCRAELAQLRTDLDSRSRASWPHYPPRPCRSPWPPSSTGCWPVSGRPCCRSDGRPR